MWECKYGKEPLDTRLCFLRLLGKSWLLIVMALAGAVVFGGFYFLTHVVYAPQREYVAESEFYIEYVNAVTQEQQYTFYNKETWESLIHTDIFMDEVMAGVTDNLDGEVTREEIAAAVFATLLTDVRIVHVTVTTNSPELTMIITDSLESAFVKFGELQREIDTIRPILIPDSATLTAFDNRTVQACILGAVVSVCFTLFFMYVYVVLDTSIYIPVEFERRYGIPMVMGEENSGENECKNDSVVVCEEQDGSAVLYVKSKDHNGPLIEKTIRELLGKNKEISKAVLITPDKKLIDWYYKTGKLV